MRINRVREPEPPKIVFVAVEHFAVVLERLAHPELAGRPLVIGGDPSERGTVVDADPASLAAGVRPGMPLRQARQLCPEAIFRPADPIRAERCFATMLAALDRFSPAVESAKPGAAYLDARGLGLLFGDDPTLAGAIAAAVQRAIVEVGGCPQLPSPQPPTPSIGMGPSKFVARAAARRSRGGVPVIVGPSAAEAFVAALPAAWLPGSALFHQRLRRLGIGTVGAFLRLPPGDDGLQFGAEGQHARRLATGEEGRSVVPRPRPAVVARAVTFERELEDRGRFERIVGRIIIDLTERLAREGRACRAIALRLALDLPREAGAGGWGEGTPAPGAPAAHLAVVERAADLPEATALPQTLTRAAWRLADALWVEGRVAALRIALVDLVPERGRQLGLFDVPPQCHAYLARAVERIERRFGPRLKRIVAVDTSALLPSRRFAQVDVRREDAAVPGSLPPPRGQGRGGSIDEGYPLPDPRRGGRAVPSPAPRSPGEDTLASPPPLAPEPRLVEVTLDARGQPIFLRWRGRRERVRVCNRWRIADDWWRRPIIRDYCRLQTASGAILVVYRDAARRWYLERVLD